MSSYFLRIVSIACVLFMCSSQVGLAEQRGQYRGKVLITPDGEMDKGAELSIEELEKQIGSIQQPYAKSSAGRHLARHYVEAGEYGKAIEYYQEALAAQGLSDVANREMLRELAQVYLLSENYPGAAQTLERALRIDLVPEVTDYLLLAQAHYKMSKYVAVVATLDRMEEKKLTLSTVQMRQALALYYRAGAYAQCENLLRRLLELEPNSPDNWHQLVSVYLQQNKKRQALDQLSLAWEKTVSFSERDIVLLADLQAYHKNPYGAAELLAEVMGQGKVEASGENYRKLFQFWLLAREKDKAGKALMKAAQLSGDIELYLYLAQLQMEQRAWQPMHQTMLTACADQLQDKYVGRANLLLGVSQLKLGDNISARRSFINATLIGGANAQAGQWLEFMNAEPTTKGEARRIVGICYGAQDKRAKVASTPSGRSAATAEKDTADPAAQDDIQIKTVPAMRIFYAKHDIPLTKLAAELRPLAVKLNINMAKAGGSAAGPLQIISTADAEEGAQASFELAIPTRGSPTARGKYRVRKLASFKCAYLVHEGAGEDLLKFGINFARALQAAGYELTGERRMVTVGKGGSMKIELQLGVE